MELEADKVSRFLWIFDMDDNKPVDQQPPAEAQLDQKALDEAAAVLQQTTVEENKAEVKEHPISEDDAKKFAGQGDFSLPVSPLDDLIGISKAGDKTEVKEPAKTEDLTATQLKTTEPEIKPEIKPVLTNQPIPGDVSTKDLEKKAKAMLGEMNSKESHDNKEKETVTAGGGVKKKKRSGTATKMALAAVVVVMMGVGGIAGMNLLKMNQNTETRSQAATCNPVPPGCSCYPEDTNHCKLDSNGVKNYFTIGCSTGCTITCEGTKDCKKEVAPPPDNPTCVWSTNPVVNKPVGYGECSTVNGKNDGEWCSCNWTQAGAVVQCAINLTKCPTSDDSVAGSGACIGANGTLVSAVAGVEVKGNCLVSTNGQSRTFFSYKCDNMETDENKGCQEDEKLITAPQACLSVPSEGWCGILQIDYPDNGNLCFVSTKIPCPSKSPEPSDEPVEKPLSCTGLQSTASTAPKIGDKVVFTCSGVGDGLSEYRFQYKIGDGTYIPLAASATEKNKSIELTIKQAGKYTAQCRVCKADGTCTAWGAAK